MLWCSAGQHAEPEFIRIRGEAGRRKKPQQQPAQQELEQQQQQDEASGSDRRSQLKSALKQVLTSGSASGQQQQQNVAGLLQELLGRRQQQVQQQHGRQQQQLLSKLESALQVLANKQKGSTMQRLRQSQVSTTACPYVWLGFEAAVIRRFTSRFLLPRTPYGLCNHRHYVCFT
jgi:hypothetical protein